MSTDYGTDLAAVDDLPDPDAYATGAQDVAYALARRLLTGDGALAEIGETVPYTSIDVREYLGARGMDAATVDRLQSDATKALREDPRVATVGVVANFGAGVLTVSVSGTGTAGPFSFVLTVDGVTTTFLRGT